MIITAGLLPLYIALYDETNPGLRPRLEAFYEKVAQKLESKGIKIIRAPFCMTKESFSDAIQTFEEKNADCIISLHMAYSPSLESIDALSATKLPLIVLDTTEMFCFNPQQSPEHILYCHGVHGVMDMCSLLNQREKPFAIAAGHWEQSDVIDRTIGFAKAAVAARALNHMRVGILGSSFVGMGDFLISDEEMKSLFGVSVIHEDGSCLSKLQQTITENEVNEEMEKDLSEGICLHPINHNVHTRSMYDCLTLRKWIENEHLNAFTINFQEISPDKGLYTMPFAEIGKAMANGIGYAGEGDVLTAAFTGAFMRGFVNASFVEIFCPDWEGNTLFLSHMGEINYGLLAGRIEWKELPFVFGKAENPIAGFGCYKSGEAMFVNVCRGIDGYRLVVSPVTMVTSSEDAFAGNVRGWMKPSCSITEFLERLSMAGATHHSTLIYGATLEQMDYFANLLKIKPIHI